MKILLKSKDDKLIFCYVHILYSIDRLGSNKGNQFYFSIYLKEKVILKRIAKFKCHINNYNKLFQI